MRYASHAYFAAVGVALAMCVGCGDPSHLASDASILPDADPLAPDAAPFAPDADPFAPDADPLAPDAAVSCSDGLDLCSGQCVDFTTNNEYCGDCSTRCGDGETCVAGDCSAGVATLVISEVHAQPAAYFELYNGGSSALDLVNHSLQWDSDGAVTGTYVLPSYTLEPGAFITLYEGAGTDSADSLYMGDSIAWSRGVGVRLLAPGSVGLDFVRTGDSVTPPPVATTWTGDNAANPGAHIDQSLVRNVFRPDTDTLADWALSAPGSPGTYCARPGRCGDQCLDFDSDSENCGACGAKCGSAQACIGGSCEVSRTGLWISEYRRYGRPGIEIHNPTSTAVAMAGHSLRIAGAANLAYIFPSFTLEPGAFVFVYMGDGLADDTSLFVGPSSAFGIDVAISLFDGGDSPLDFVRFGTSSAPPPAGTSWFGDNVPTPTMDSDQSARRTLGALDSDGPTDWAVHTPSSPGSSCNASLAECGGGCAALAEDPMHCGACDNSCGANETCSSGLCSSSGAVVISELNNSSTEWFELFNGTAAEVDLGGWRLGWVADSETPATFTIPMGTIVPAGGFIGFYEGSGTSSATLIYMGQVILWSDAIAVSLLDGSGDGVDFARTGDSVATPPAGIQWTGVNAINPPNSASSALKRQVYGADTDSAADWSVEPRSLAKFCGPTNERSCGGTCTNVMTDAESCGACGNVCSSGAICSIGECVHEGALRLVRVSTTNGVDEGRMDMFESGKWRILYYAAIATTGVGVGCRQLGFSSGEDVGSLSSSPCVNCSNYIDGLSSCTGTEIDLADCTHAIRSGSVTGVRARCTP